MFFSSNFIKTDGETMSSVMHYSSIMYSEIILHSSLLTRMLLSRHLLLSYGKVIVRGKGEDIGESVGGDSSDSEAKAGEKHEMHLFDCSAFVTGF